MTLPSKADLDLQTFADFHFRTFEYRYLDDVARAVDLSNSQTFTAESEALLPPRSMECAPKDKELNTVYVDDILSQEQVLYYHIDGYGSVWAVDGVGGTEVQLAGHSSLDERDIHGETPVTLANPI